MSRGLHRDDHEADVGCAGRWEPSAQPLAQLAAAIENAAEQVPAGRMPAGRMRDEDGVAAAAMARIADCADPRT